jgi:hypothetical protein
METVCFSETLVSTYKSARPDSPADRHQHLHRRKNLKSHTNDALYSSGVIIFDIFCRFSGFAVPFCEVSHGSLRPDIHFSSLPTVSVFLIDPTPPFYFTDIPSQYPSVSSPLSTILYVIPFFPILHTPYLLAGGWEQAIFHPPKSPPHPKTLS